MPARNELPEEETSDSATVDSFLRKVASAPHLAALPTPGDLVGGKYRIERLLGAGAMGAVFAARHELLQQGVALKVMLPEIASSRSAADRFLNEARSAARIEGEHVARVLDVGHLENEAPFIAMELLDGADLAQVLAERGQFSQRDALRYLLQALEAVAQAHALGIVHRDLKPANLFLARRRDGSRLVKVLDFGISKVQNAHTTTSPNALTQSSAMLGSPLYMSPEQVRNSSSVDARADIWAFGVILFEMLAGSPPFDARTVHHVLVQIIEEQPLALGQFRTDLPPELERIISRCLSKDRERRFNDVAELARALAPYAGPETRDSVARIVGSVAPQAASSTRPESSLALAATELGSQSVPARLNPSLTTDRAGSKRLVVAGGIALGLVAGGAFLALKQPPPSRIFTPTSAASAASAASAPLAPLAPITPLAATAPSVELHPVPPPASASATSLAPNAPPKKPPTPKPALTRRPPPSDPFDTPR